MTLFAGVIAREPVGSAIPDAVVAQLAHRLSRRPGERVDIDAGAGYAMASIDTGAFDGGARRIDADSISLLAGDPLLGPDASPERRAEDFDRLHAAWAHGDEGSLAEARGAFCAAHFDRRHRRLWLIPDKLALRPLYYALLDPFIVFATSLRALLECGLVPRAGEMRGLIEIASFGGALGERTGLAAVRGLEPGRIVELRSDGTSVRDYWHWDTAAESGASDDDICGVVRSGFDRAVRARLGAGRRAVSLLSGGLDSRCVVLCLREQGVDLHTIGFGPAGTADDVLARDVAAAIDARHFAYAGEVSEFWSRLAAAHATWVEQVAALDRPPVQQLWTGEGGDRVLAPVNLTEDVIASMRGGDVDSAIARYLRLENVAVARRLFTRRNREHVMALPKGGIRDALARIGGDDGGRRFHLYVLLEEARRNIRPHYEDLDLHRIELVMPFYDSDLVASVLRYPIDRFVRHRLYNRLMDFMPRAAARIPWQAYPGSEPCPLPLPSGLKTQWEAWHTPAQQRAMWRRSREIAAQVMNARPFPGWLLNRPVLRAARVLLRFGTRRYDHLFSSALPFVTYPPDRPPGSAP
ncbi:MAG: hypothetical protein CMLOHMNK_01395 [Steroidobacteraceae bacterium]|nr:hypothetical protein [Steroidobacteraceae bacterium]